MAIKLGATFARFIPMIGYHHILMMISAASVILLSILVAGCTSSNGLSNVYLLSLQYRNSSTVATDPSQVNPAMMASVYNISELSSATPILEVRAGYMGLCVLQGDSMRLCSSSAATLANTFKSGANASSSDPLNLIYMAKVFKDNIVFDGLIFIAIALVSINFLLLSTFPGWHEETDADGEEREVKPFPSRPVSYAALAVVTLGFAFILIAILWQHVNSSAAASMAEILTYGAIDARVGVATMVLGWIAVVLIAIVGIGLLVMVLSIRLIRKLTDEESENTGSEDNRSEHAG